MKKLTPQEQQRIWKQDTNPVRKILLWGFDSEKNPCLLILYGEQKTEREIKSSPRAYYAEAYLLEAVVRYSHYAVFHGVNGHLPSVPNVYYSKEENILCHKRGFNMATRRWEYDNKTRRYKQVLDIDEKYIVKEFYKLNENIEFDYYAENKYEDYVSYLKANFVTFEDCELIEDPSELFGFGHDSIYYNAILDMFSKERLYSRKKCLAQFMHMQPSEEEYERILKVASVELACGIFQELTIEKNPVLLKIAKQIKNSNELWAKKEYHDGLMRCIEQYISSFDEKLMNKQKEFIYRTLPEMDFHIKKLKLYGETMSGEELKNYLNGSYNVYCNLSYQFVFGNQKLYEKNTYTDGKDIYNVQFKNTIQTAKAYGMADAIGKIAYYLDAPRTTYYLKGSGRGKTYDYYVRYLRRTIDAYKEDDELKFIEAAREMLTSYTDNDSLGYWVYEPLSNNFFFNRYFNSADRSQTEANAQMWERHIEDVVYISKNAKTLPVHRFCYDILKRANARHEFDEYDVKELIVLSQIPYDKTARLFEKILFPKLKEMHEFEADIMLALMSTNSAALQKAAKNYFKQTNGKFMPEDVVKIISMDTIETWYNVLKSNINAFAPHEYVAFLKELMAEGENFAKRGTELSENVVELLNNSLNKLDDVSDEAEQGLLCHAVAIVLSNVKMPEFVMEIVENVVFHMPYDRLKTAVQSIGFEHGAISERNCNIIALLKSMKEYVLPKDGVILSVLETSSAKLVKTLTEIIEKLQNELLERQTTLLLLFECNVYALNKISQNVFENLETEKREKIHMILLDSPVEKVYQYALKKLDDWYGSKTPVQFISRMLEHPCVDVKSYISNKMENAFSNLKEVQPDLYIYYAKTLLYLPNKVSKSKENVYSTMPAFLSFYPQKREEIEQMLLDIGSENSKTNSERALVAFAQIQKEVCEA
ncbi:MAG: hypothetical protein HFE62_01355 [Firmicutes bacterium]|nr:hypothetical protein [Bacillota bacterium]